MFILFQVRPFLHILEAIQIDEWKNQCCMLQGHQDPECKVLRRLVPPIFCRYKDPKNLKLHICWHFFAIGGGSTVCASYLLAVHTSYILGTIERKLIKKIRTLEKWLQYRPLPNSFPTNYILINSSIVFRFF